MLLSLILAVVLSILAVFFANDNQELINLQFFGLPLQSKTGIVVVVAFALGAVLGVAAMLPAYVAQGWALIRTRRKVEDLERTGRSESVMPSKQV